MPESPEASSGTAKPDGGGSGDDAGASTHGHKRETSGSRPEAATRAAVLVADFVEPARATALEKLDEGRQALTIATGWLHSKVAPPGSPEGLIRPPQAPTP